MVKTQKPLNIPTAAMVSAPACKGFIVCNDLIGDPPTCPTIIFQWVGVSLILAQRVHCAMYIMNEKNSKDYTNSRTTSLRLLNSS